MKPVSPELMRRWAEQAPWPFQKACMYAKLFSMTHSDEDLKTARDLAAGLDNFSKCPQPNGAEGFVPMARSNAFLAIYRATKDPADLAQARKGATPFFFLNIYRDSNDPADLAKVLAEVKDSNYTITNVWWLLQIYAVSHDQQYIEQARHFAKKQGVNNGDYLLSFLEIYKVTKDPSDLASARESRGDIQSLIKIYGVSQDPADIVLAREILENDPSQWNKVHGFVQIWLITRQPQDLEAARKLAENVSHYLTIYRATSEDRDINAARKFIGGISDSFSFDKVGGFLEIYRFTKDPQDLDAAKKAVAKVKEKSKRAVAAEMVRRATIQAQAPNKEVKEKYASSS